MDLDVRCLNLHITIWACRDYCGFCLMCGLHGYYSLVISAALFQVCVPCHNESWGKCSHRTPSWTVDVKMLKCHAKIFKERVYGTFHWKQFSETTIDHDISWLIMVFHDWSFFSLSHGCRSELSLHDYVTKRQTPPAPLTNQGDHKQMQVVSWKVGRLGFASFTVEVWGLV